MRRLGFILALMLLTGYLTACQHKDNIDTEEPVIGITIDFPAYDYSPTKGDVGQLPASTLENTLHSLMVWVFRSDDKSLVASRRLNEEDFPVGGGIRRYSLPVSEEFVSEKPDVDIFILANAASINAQLDENSSWTELNTAYFRDNETAPYYGFGLSHPVHAVDAGLGLPMSGCGKNLKIEGEDPVLKVRTVKINRAVSRLQFVFCKTRTEGDEEEQDNVSIQRVVLIGRQIPLKEYVFTTQKTGIVLREELTLEENYDPLSYIIPGPSVIADNDTPENLIYVNQDPLVYDKLLSDAIANNTLTDMGYTYLRETDKRLTGYIDYTVNGVQRTREFNMASLGDFSRNHTWTVFGYFLGGRNLQLALNVLPWDYNSYYVDFSEESVSVSSKFAVDEHSAEITLTSKEHYDARLLPGTAARGHLYITTPVGGKLMIRPIGDAHAFQIIPDIANIDPTVESGRIDILIRRNPDIDEDLTGCYITLSFSVETADGRIIDANSEAVDAVYRFVI